MADSPTNSTPRTPARRTPAESSASGPPAKRSRSSRYFGLYALQHRGQESAGIAVSATAPRSWSTRTWAWSPRSSTRPPCSPCRATWPSATPATPPPAPRVWENAQPTFRADRARRRRAGPQRQPDQHRRAGPAGRRAARTKAGSHPTSSASDLGHRAHDRAAGRPTPTAPWRTRPPRCCRSCAAPSPWSSWTRPRSTRRATRRASGRWCSAAWSAAGWWPPSSAALDIVGAELRPRDRARRADRHRRERPAHRSASPRPQPKGCVFEYVYLARPDTTISGRNVHAVAGRDGPHAGARGARSRPTSSSPTPESGTPAAIGYAEESGIPYGQGLVKNAYVGRTFIQPSQTIRQLGIRLKLNPLREVIEGKRLVVVDDSIVRGNTQRALVRMLREAGATEVHVRISSPPVKWPCFYGIDFATRAELIANGLTIDEIATSIGADSLALHLPRRHDRGDAPCRPTGCAAPASTACTRSSCPSRSCSASTCWRSGRPLARPTPVAADRPTTSATTPTADAPAPVDARRRADTSQRSELSASETTGPAGATYAAAGVDIEAGDRAVELMKEWVAKARRPEVLGGIGGFAGPLRRLRAEGLRRGRCWPPPPTASAPRWPSRSAMDMHDTIGFDLVGMVVDDLVVCGAEPLFMTDYIATGKVVPERIAAIVKGIAEALRRWPAARWSAARPPSTRACSSPDEYDVAGAGDRRGRGRRSCSAPSGSAPATCVVAMASSGAALQRLLAGAARVLPGRPAGSWTGDVPEFGRTLGEELLEPTRIYSLDCLALIAATTEVHAFVAHHRRRPGGEPRAGHPGGPARRGSTASTWTPAGGLRPGRPSSAASSTRSWRRP